jgi:hypothetical protein
VNRGQKRRCIQAFGPKTSYKKHIFEINTGIKYSNGNVTVLTSRELEQMMGSCVKDDNFGFHKSSSLCEWAHAHTVYDNGTEKYL